jgi:hypothetical protein
MNCPVCERELNEVYRHSCVYGTEESLHQCEHCGNYSERFSYGSTGICVGDFMTGYHYTIDCNDLKELRKKIQEVAKLYSEEETL